MDLKRLKQKSVPYIFVLPYFFFFFLFVAIPVVIAVILSFTNFNAIQTPSFVGIKNYVDLFLQDEIFIRYVIPNTVVFAVIVGPGGYLLSFLLAWALSQTTKGPRTILALIIYSPSMTAGTTMAVIWKVLFSGDQLGYINNILIRLDIITEPIIFLQSKKFLLPVMIIVALWGSMGVGFLSMLAGLLNIDPYLYEAARIDGIRNRFQEMIYITIPSIKPQMLFGAIMAIVNAFKQSAIGVSLSGANPTPNYAGQLMVNHISDYGFIRYEMGYACAVSVILLLIIWFFSKGARILFKED